VGDGFAFHRRDGSQWVAPGWLRSLLRLASSLCRDPRAHVPRAVDEPNPGGLQAREKLHPRPVDEDDVLEIEGDRTICLARDEILKPDGVLAIDVSTQREDDRARRR